MAQAGDAGEKGRILTMYSVQVVLVLRTRNLVVKMSVLTEWRKFARFSAGWLSDWRLRAPQWRPLSGAADLAPVWFNFPPNGPKMQDAGTAYHSKRQTAKAGRSRRCNAMAR